MDLTTRELGELIHTTVDSLRRSIAIRLERDLRPHAADTHEDWLIDEAVRIVLESPA